MNRSIEKSSANRWLLLGSILVSLVAYGGMIGLHLRYGTLRDGYTPYTLGLYALAFAAYLGALLVAERRQAISPQIIWGGAIAFRVLLLFTTPTLSDDVYRYLWDGYIANNGVSPYAFPIDAPELDDLDIPLRSQANNRWMASPYLPGAQLLFAGLTNFLPLQPLLFQTGMVIFDLLSGILILSLLKTAGLPGYRVMVYLWNPLVVVEVAHGAHVDAWMIFLALFAVWLTLSPGLSGPSRWAAPLALALATTTKILPALLLPVLFWRWRWGQLLLYGLLVAGLLAPFGLQTGWGLTGPLAGTGLFGALRIYADQWNFNSGFFHWLETDLLPALAVTEANDVAKRIVGLLLGIVLAITWLLARRRTAVRATLRLMAVPYMAYLLLTTTVHPWYALILLAFVPFMAPASSESGRRWLAVAPWLYLSAALPLSYLTYLDPFDFRELAWVRRVEWLPAIALLGLWWLVLRASRDSNI